MAARRDVSVCFVWFVKKDMECPHGINEMLIDKSVGPKELPVLIRHRMSVGFPDSWAPTDLSTFRSYRAGNYSNCIGLFAGAARNLFFRRHD